MIGDRAGADPALIWMRCRFGLDLQQLFRTDGQFPKTPRRQDKTPRFSANNRMPNSTPLPKR
jgi:hypothetical protein